MNDQNQETSNEIEHAMTTVSQSETNDTEQSGQTELDVLKARAKLMGISHSGNIGVEALRAKINEKLNGTEEEKQNEPVLAQSNLNPLAGDTNDEQVKPVAKMTFREQYLADAMKLIRVRITCMNPAKKELHGEVLCVGNDMIGTVKKFIPYGEYTDSGFHLPNVLFQELESRRFQNIRVTKDRRTGRDKVETSWAKEFALEVLPPLTQEELDQLATAQIAAGSLNE